MQQDFHYYCVAVLAKAAGFQVNDALAIAYASQYVDDATESGLMRLEGQEGDLKFDPVRTSYFGLELFRSVSWSAQKRIWIPFHFLPPRPFSADVWETFSFITRPGSPFAHLLLQQAAGEPLANYKRRLCRIGIALHTYADTWAHQDFSGRKSGNENDVESIYLWDRESGEFIHLGIENILFDTLPQIGHAEAGFFPDIPFFKWKCTLRRPSPEEITRDNIEVFLDAAKNIYTQLRAMEKANADMPIPWSEVESQIRILFTEEDTPQKSVNRLATAAYRAYLAAMVEKRCIEWKRVFDDLFHPYEDRFFYNLQTWRKQAVEGDTDWDNYSELEWAQMAPLTLRPGFWDSMWVHFHRAALRQRHFVLENLP